MEIALREQEDLVDHIFLVRTRSASSLKAKAGDIQNPYTPSQVESQTSHQGTKKPLLWKKVKHLTEQDNHHQHLLDKE